MKLQFDPSFDELTECLQRMAVIAEAAEWDNRKHLERIRGYSFLLASALNLNKKEATIISLACMVHDVGKIYTPLSLLQRSGNYSPQEWMVIEKHTLQGSSLLESSTSTVLQIGANVSLTHHERWDGTGYPNHISGEQIPLCGRICAVVDVFDALTTRRSYKEITSEVEAFRLIGESSGTLFDPEIAEVFRKNSSEIVKIKNG